MDTAKCGGIGTTLEHVAVFPSFFGVLDDVDVLLVLAITAHIAQGVAERGAKALEDCW